MMGSRAKKILLDTNVWVDYADVARPGHDDAKRLLDHLLSEPDKHEICYFAGSIKDAYYILDRSMKASLRETEGAVDPADARAMNAIAWAVVATIDEMATPLPLDSRALWMAPKLREYSSDFEDCLLLATCELFDVDYLVTGDKQLLKQAPGAAFTAREMLAYYEAIG